MKTILLPSLATLASLLRSRAVLHLEILALRQQLWRWSPPQTANGSVSVALSAYFGSGSTNHLWPGCLDTLVVFKADTVVRWHRKGFRLYWTWKSQRRGGGRPTISPVVRDLIRRVSQENPLWGAPRVHGELQMLGVGVSQTTVAKYMVRHRRPPSQSWRTVLDDHVRDLASVDFFTVPTVTFRILHVFLVLKHERRRVVHSKVTEHPTAQWTAQQPVEAFPVG
jgi:putative transposase